MSPTRVSLETGIDEYMVALRVERGLAPNTIAAYQRDLGQYLEYLEGRPTSEEEISGFISSLRARGLADSTIARKIASIRGLHRFLVREEMWEVDPTALIDSPRRYP